MATWASRLERLGPVLIPAGVGVGLAAWLMPIALHRLIDGDEGYLLMAARLVGEGRWPYRDFFFTQTPLLPLVFGGLFLVVGRGWVAARLLSGALAVALGFLVYRETLAATRRQGAAVFAAALFALSGDTVGWLTIAKGFGLSALLIVLAVHLVGRSIRMDSSTRGLRPDLVTAGAGLAAGLATSTRLYAVVVIPILAAYLLTARFARQRRTIAYAVGCGLGLMPAIVCFLLDRRAFLFDTILYHGVREYGQRSLFGSASAKLPEILKSMGIDPWASYGERQWMGLAILAALGLALRVRWRDDSRSAAGVVGLALLAASMLPNPFQPQYLCLPVPLFAVEAGRLCAALSAMPCRFRLYRRLVTIAALGYVAYQGWVGCHDRHRYLWSGVAVPGIESVDRVDRWRVDTVEAVARAIDARGDSLAASWWPGYFVSTRTPIVVDLANDFGLRAAGVLSAAERRRLHVVTHAEVGDMIKQRQPRLFIEGNWATYPFVSWLPQYGYRVRATVHNVRLWACD